MIVGRPSARVSTRAPVCAAAWTEAAAPDVAAPPHVSLQEAIWSAHDVPKYELHSSSVYMSGPYDWSHASSQALETAPEAPATAVLTAMMATITRMAPTMWRMAARMPRTAAAMCWPPPVPFVFGPQQQRIEPAIRPRRPPIDGRMTPPPGMAKPSTLPAMHFALFTSGASSGFEPHILAFD